MKANKFTLTVIVLAMLTGCAGSSTPSATLPPAPTITPTENPIPSEIQTQMAQLDAAGITGYTYGNGKLLASDGKVISIDSMGVITAPNESGLSWWSSETKNWVVVNPTDETTYPSVYLAHWNSLATRNPNTQLTPNIIAEDQAFNSFQVESYRDFFLSPTFEYTNDPLWQTFITTNGSDLSKMSSRQIYEASIIYGQISHEVIMPIVSEVQNNQGDVNNWLLNTQTSDGLGIICPQPDKAIAYYKSQGIWWHNENVFGKLLKIDSGPFSHINGTLLDLFKIPGKDPNNEVGVDIGFDGHHLSAQIKFSDIISKQGDWVASYAGGDQIFTHAPRNATSPSFVDQFGNKIDQNGLKILIRSRVNIMGGDDLSGYIAVFSSVDGQPGLIYLNRIIR